MQHFLGKAHEYRGPISVTESGTECADWSALSASMRSEMQESIELLKKRRKRKGFVRSSVNSAAEKVFIAIANDSLVEMEEKGKNLMPCRIISFNDSIIALHIKF